MIHWIIASLLAFFVKGLCSFGDGLIFSTYLSFFSGYAAITPTATVLSLPSNMILTWKNRKKLQPKVYLPVMAMLLAGDLVGTFLLKNLDTHVLKLIFGIFIVLLGVDMILRERAQKLQKSSPVVMTVIGIISGIISGMFGIGALLTAYFSRVTENTESFSANICIVYTVDTALRLGLYAATGILTWTVLKGALLLLPVSLAALLGGIKSASFLNERTVKKAVIVLLIVSGLALVRTSLL